MADLDLLFATTARAHDQAKPVVAPEEAAREITAHVAAGGKAGIMFGRERAGLENDEVALANRIITFPVNPGFASLNLAQAVLLMGYEWFKLATGGALPFAMPERSERASQHQIDAFFEESDPRARQGRVLAPAVEKRETMLVNLRNIFTRMDPTKQDMHTLHGVVMAIAEGRKGPAQGRRARRRAGDAAAGAARRTRAGHAARRAARCAASPACCGETRPTPSASCGNR